MRRLMAGEPITIAAVGGSVTGAHALAGSMPCCVHAGYVRRLKSVRGRVRMSVFIRTRHVRPHSDAALCCSDCSCDCSSSATLSWALPSASAQLLVWSAAGTGTHDTPEERYMDRLFRWVNETFPHPEHRCVSMSAGAATRTAVSQPGKSRLMRHNRELLVFLAVCLAVCHGECITGLDTWCSLAVDVPLWMDLLISFSVHRVLVQVPSTQN